MRKIFEKRHSFLGLTAFLMLSMTVGQSTAQLQDSDEMDVTAGIVTGFTVSCVQDMSFGIINIEPGTLADPAPAEIVISGDTTGSVSIANSEPGVSVNGYRRGECTVAGLDDTVTQVHVAMLGNGSDGNDNATVGLEGLNGAVDLGEPVSPISGIVAGPFAMENSGQLKVAGVSDRPFPVTDGRANFKINGSLTIPNPADIDADNLGGYGATVEIYASDTVGGITP